LQVFQRTICRVTVTPLCDVLHYCVTLLCDVLQWEFSTLMLYAHAYAPRRHVCRVTVASDLLWGLIASLLRNAFYVTCRKVNPSPRRNPYPAL